MTPPALTNGLRWSVWLAFAAVIVYVFACVAPIEATGFRGSHGFLLLYLGALGLLGGFREPALFVSSLPWLANLLWLGGVIALACGRWRGAAWASGVAILVAFTAILLPGDLELTPAFHLWWLSMAIVTGGALVRGQEVEAERHANLLPDEELLERWGPERADPARPGAPAGAVQPLGGVLPLSTEARDEREDDEDRPPRS